MNLSISTSFLAALATAAVAAGAFPLPAAYASDSGATVELIATGTDADASGRAKLRVRSADDARFEIRARGLEPLTSYQVVVDEVHVADITTAEDGRARARLRSRPRSSSDGLLGFDPRGSILLVRDAAGQDVLAGDIAPGGNEADDSKIVCCVPDDSGAECEDRTPAECSAEGGTVSTATSCLPNPCDTVTPPTEDDVVCCLPDDSGPECEDRTVEQCSAEGGIVVDADSCLASPCAAVPPAFGLTRCCEADDSGNECEVRLPSECTARGGVDIGEGTCSIDACAGIPVPTGIEELDLRCEKRSSRSRISVDASGLRAGSYTAHVVSGTNEATAPAAATVGDEVEFDFDSDGGDIGAGATAIAATFLQIGSVTAQVLDANGNVVLEGSAVCSN